MRLLIFMFFSLSLFASETFIGIDDKGNACSVKMNVHEEKVLLNVHFSDGHKKVSLDRRRASTQKADFYWYGVDKGKSLRRSYTSTRVNALINPITKQIGVVNFFKKKIERKWNKVSSKSQKSYCLTKSKSMIISSK